MLMMSVSPSHQTHSSSNSGSPKRDHVDSLTWKSVAVLRQSVKTRYWSVAFDDRYHKSHSCEPSQNYLLNSATEIPSKLRDGICSMGYTAYRATAWTHDTKICQGLLYRNPGLNKARVVVAVGATPWFKMRQQHSAETWWAAVRLDEIIPFMFPLSHHAGV